MSTEEILRVIPERTLPGKKETVDLITGIETYDRITDEMHDIPESPLSSQTALIAITHTQQLNALALETNHPATCLRNYGFLLVTSSKVKLFPEGLYKKHVL